MATLADVLRKTGYSQDGKLTPVAPIAPTLTTILGEHIRTLPQQIEANQRAMDKTTAGMDKYDIFGQPNPNYYPEAMGEFTQNFMPGLIGSISKLGPAAERFLIAQKNAALPIEKGGLGLLPDNTQWQRAEAMGFNVREPMYHGTQKEFNQFDLAKHGSATDKGDFGKAVYVTTDPDIAKVYAFDSKTNNQGSQVLPLLVKEGKQYKVNGQQGMNELIEKLGGEDKWFDLSNNPEAYAKAVKELGYDSVRDRGYAQTAIYDPTSIRSKFAAFDPKRAKEADILAAGLAVPIVEDKKKTRKELLEQELKKRVE